MKIIKQENSHSIKGNKETFSGNVYIDNFIAPEKPSRLIAGTVTFEPGSRTAWHTHGVGQLLYVTSGIGWIQKEGEEKLEIKAGDTVWISAGEKHWHGATDTNVMVHIAIAEASETEAAAIWNELVTDEQYSQ